MRPLPFSCPIIQRDGAIRADILAPSLDIFPDKILLIGSSCSPPASTSLASLGGHIVDIDGSRKRVCHKRTISREQIRLPRQQ